MNLISGAELRNDIKGKNILVDTNIIIYLTDNISPYASLSRMLFEMVESGSVFAYFSMVSIAEVLLGPLRKGLEQKALEVRDYLMNFPNSDCQEINRSVIDYIGNDKQIDWSKLRTLDSLIIASGLANHVDVFISNDEHFHRALPSPMLRSFSSRPKV
jgi:predicted nucleic acid-binding protein